MPPKEVPQVVLAERLAEVIDGRKVRAAVFTTFCFDPGFFELHILPTLFDCVFNQVDKVKLIQLEEALQAVEDISVYYDRSAISQDALPPQLDFRRLDVRVSQGVFHPKLVLVLVENQQEDEAESGETVRGPESLIVGTLSANLTRAGWWENLEVGHFEEIDDKDYTSETYPFRKDLLALVRRVMNLGGPNEEQLAMGRIHEFLRRRAPTKTRTHHSAGGRHYTRLFFGQSKLPDWLEELHFHRETWNLEVISPYFDAAHSGTLKKMIAVLQPKETRVYLPQDMGGKAKVTGELYKAIDQYAYWSKLPAQMLRPGARAATKDASPRFVHAKSYRLWSKSGKQVVLVGSVNLTSAAHSRVGAGNLEASFLVDISDAGVPLRWWMEPLEQEPTEFVTKDPSEAEECEEVFVDISIRYDWATEKLAYRIKDNVNAALTVADPSGRQLFVIDRPVSEQWVACESTAAEQVRELLRSTSFLQIQHPKGFWRVLVREEGMSHRPSLLTTLTPEEILLYWSLLSDSQREAFITERVGAVDAQLEGIAVHSHRYFSSNTIFDRFAGIFHAFEQLYQSITNSIEQKEVRHAEAKLFGAKYDSLPQLLQKTLDQNEDAVMRYIIFLCANQLRDRIKQEQMEFWKERRVMAKSLDALLEQLPQLKTDVPIEREDREQFLDWFETMFTRMIEQPEDAA